MTLDDGAALIVSSDDEGKQPAVLFYAKEDNPFFGLPQRSYAPEIMKRLLLTP